MAKKKGTQHRTTEQQLADAELRLNRLREQARRNDTRRKILIGAMVMGRAEASDAEMEKLLRDLDAWLASGHRDRRLWFDNGLGQVSGLYGAKLHQVQPGWAFGRALSPVPKPMRDRYGNPITA